MGGPLHIYPMINLKAYGLYLRRGSLIMKYRTCRVIGCGELIMKHMTHQRIYFSHGERPRFDSSSTHTCYNCMYLHPLQMCEHLLIGRLQSTLPVRHRFNMMIKVLFSPLLASSLYAMTSPTKEAELHSP
jgi:hypothetical protein